MAHVFLSDLSEVGSYIVARLLTDEALSEASVHLPKRGRRWIACFTGPDGGQVWRTTGLVDRDQALRLAQLWEQRARSERARLGLSIRKAVSRVGSSEPSAGIGPLTQREVAQLLNLSERAVRNIERRAIEKLKEHPLLRQVWRKYLEGELDEDGLWLNGAEVTALFSLAQNSTERQLIQKVLRLIQKY